MTARTLLESCYPELSSEKHEQLLSFEELLLKTNQRINLVSRKETAFMERHIIPSLLPLKVIDPPHDAKMADIGTGGGLPGIPLAIAFPGMDFLLIDSTRKKLDAIEGMIRELELPNVRTEHQRVEKAKFKADLITGRAVTALPKFIAWCKPHLAKCSEREGDRGILYWTGGELDPIQAPDRIFEMKDYFDLEELASKKLVFVPIGGA